jgi:5-methyltetrahydrofolate--homocysteine methyltransferase
LGANVGVDENTVWFEPAKTLEAADIHPQFDAQNFWWRWTRSITQEAVDRWGNQVTVATTDLGGNLDIIASLRGTQNLLLDLYDCPKEIDRLTTEITQLWLHYYDELDAIIQTAGCGTSAWTPLWCPGRYYMLQSDFCYMISPEMFERWVMPDLETICKHIDYGFYHLDGKGQIPHLDMLLSIENLRGVQWVPGDGQPHTWEWLPLLKRIRDAGKLCQIYATPAGALTVTRELGGKGFMFWLTDPMNEADAAAFLKALELENKL